MDTKEILKDIGMRTNGDIYLGVVGPVRCGKSTFIKRFMEVAIIPNVSDEYVKSRMIDELPQSGIGKTIMTMEPKFVPNIAATVAVEEKFSIKVRLVDCVGYTFKEAKGFSDESGVRMVKTPWLEESIPFDEAARIGTKKVIQDHSTIGIVMTSDGTIMEFDRDCYVKAEEEVIIELQKINKPFIVLVNSKEPGGEKAMQAVKYIEEKYNVTSLAINAEMMDEKEVRKILQTTLDEFPIVKIDVSLPKWVAVLDDNNWLKIKIKETVDQAMKKASKIKDVNKIKDTMMENEHISKYDLSNVNTSTGLVNIEIDVVDGLYDQIMKEIVGHEIVDKSELLAILQEHSQIKKDYSVLKDALTMADKTGYGYASPTLDSVMIERPQLVKQGSRYGVKVKAKGCSYHILKIDVDTAFEPIIGDKHQSEGVATKLGEDFDKDPKLVFENQMFGRKVGDVIIDGVNSKLISLSEPTKVKVQQLVKTLTNKGKGSFISIIY